LLAVSSSERECNQKVFDVINVLSNGSQVNAASNHPQPKRKLIMRLTILAASAMLMANPSFATTIFRVGTGVGCTHASIQDALTAAVNDGNQESEIRITRSLTYTNQALRVTNDRALKLLGGYARCIDEAPTAPHTSISGSGGAKQSVLSFHGWGEITIDRLDISGGDAEDHEKGGAIYYGTTGFLRVFNSVIHHNRAGLGGGIAIEHPDAVLRIGENVLIHDNYANDRGGGVYCKDAEMLMIASGSGFFYNRALQEGGGMRLQNCDAQIASDGPLGAGVLYNNSAYQGGGMSNTGSDVSIYTWDANRPTRISFNHATSKGGAMMIRDAGIVRLFDTIVEGNSAGDGGVAYLHSDTSHSPHITASSMKDPSTALNAPFLAVPCASHLRCNRFFNNSARANGSTVGEGAIVYSTYETPFLDNIFVPFIPNGRGTMPDFRMAMVDHNTGNSLFRINQYHDHWAIAQSQITENNVRESLIKANSSDTIHVTQNTISHNTVASSLIKARGLDLRCSIVNQSNRIHEGSSLFAQFVLVPNSALLPPSTTTLQAVPKFINAAQNDYRLLATDNRSGSEFSPGIDFSASDCGQDGTATDRNGVLRPIDLRLSNQFGSFDLGAYEAFLREFIIP
jgi:hypothetical protein